MIKGYHTDNGIFDALEFMEDLLKKQKNIRFSGDGASHQNEESERAINMLVNMPRNMLMHSVLRCPEYTFTTDLWPMSMCYVLWVYNSIPDIKSGLSAIEILSRSRFEPVSETLRNCLFGVIQHIFYNQSFRSL